MPSTDPRERLLQAHLDSEEFHAGVGAGHWRLIDLFWPVLTVALTLGQHELGLRIDVDGYGPQAPAGQPWNLDEDTSLPMGQWPVTGKNPEVFRHDWSPQNGNAPYLACDRLALAGHNWAEQNPDQVWNAGRTIVFYLDQLHRYLRGARLPGLAPSGTT